MRDGIHAVLSRTGQHTIDAEHVVQLQLLDSLSEIVNKEEGLAAASLIKEQFIEFSVTHFLSEQLVIRLHGDPGYEAHLGEHTRLMKSVREIRSKLQQGEEKINIRLIEELRIWLLTHIASKDVAFGEFLKNKGGKSS